MNFYVSMRVSTPPPAAKLQKDSQRKALLAAKTNITILLRRQGYTYWSWDSPEERIKPFNFESQL